MTEDVNPGSMYDAARKLAAEGTVAIIATVVEGDGLGNKALLTTEIIDGSLGSDDLHQSVLAWVSSSDGTPQSTIVSPDDETRIFCDVFEPASQLVIFGAVHTAQALDAFARRLGYRVIVTDARRALATRERFPHTDQLLIGWPEEVYQQLTITSSTAIAILSHDPKFDEPAMLGALQTDAQYIGAVGSRSTNKDRRERLQEAGMSDEQIARIRGPIGLDIGGSTPEEMAVSILAEMIAVAHGRDGRALSVVKGAIRGE